MDKEIRADAKLKRLTEEQQDELWLMRNPTAGGEPVTYEEIQVDIPLKYGFTVSLSTLSEFYSWLRLKRRMAAATARAEQTKLQLLSQPGLTPVEIERVAQMVFTAEALEEGNTKAYVQLARLRLQEQKLTQEGRKLAMLEKKAAQADKAGAVLGDGKLSEQEKAAKLKQIFRMG